MPAKRTLHTLLRVGLIGAVTGVLAVWVAAAGPVPQRVEPPITAFVSSLQPAVVRLEADGSGDYPTLQDALEDVPAGAVIHLGPGTYRCEDGPFEVNRSLTLAGAGMDETRVVCDVYDHTLGFRRGGLLASDITFAHEGASDADAVEVVGGQAEFYRCGFTGGTAARGDTSTTGSGLHAGGTAQVHVSDSLATGNRWGISYTDHARGLTLRSRLTDNVIGLVVFGLGQVGAFDCECSGNGNTGIAIDHSPRATIMSNRCSDNGEFGIEVTGQAETLLLGNTCAANGDAGISFRGVGNDGKPWCGGQARANVCTDNGREGISVRGLCTPVLEDNVCEGNAFAGIGFRFLAGGQARGNSCSGGQFGLFLDASAEPVLGKNSCALNLEEVPAPSVRLSETVELTPPSGDCYPNLSPSGSRYLCYRRGEDDQPEMWLASLDEGLIRLLVAAKETVFEWVDDGSIVYARLPRPETGPLVPVTLLDLDTGEETELGRTYEVGRIQTDPSGLVAFLSDEGLRVVNRGQGLEAVVPIRLGPEAWCGLGSGSESGPTPTPPPWTDAYSYIGVRFAVAPDGSKAAILLLKDECARLVIVDVATGAETLVTDDLSYSSVAAPYYPLAWSPDSSTLAYSLYRPDTRVWELWLVDGDGSDARPLWAPGEWKRRYDYLTWLGDSLYLAFQQTGGNLDATLQVIDSRGGEPVTLLEGIHESVQVSPDGRRVVYSVGGPQTPAAEWRNYRAELEW